MAAEPRRHHGRGLPTAVRADRTRPRTRRPQPLRPLRSRGGIRGSRPRYPTRAAFVAVLRHPVDRVHSDYLHEWRGGREPSSTLEGALSRGDDDRQPYVWKSHYAAHIERYAALFPPDQLRVLVYEDYLADPNDFMRELYEFLGVSDPGPDPPPAHQGRRSGVARSAVLDRVLGSRVASSASRVLPGTLKRRVRNGLHNLNTDRPEIDPATRTRLLRVFEEDVRYVEDWLGRPLPAWHS
ncbi:MAG: sulfotransferase [Acidimicrobiia bacterium]|nr:sulfotransferase [Acidimicrobiia bacterium]